MWPWSYGNYLRNQYLSPLMLWIWISIRARCTTLCDKVCQWLATCQWFSPGPLVSSTNKTVLHDISEILLKMTGLNTIKQTTNNRINQVLTDVLWNTVINAFLTQSQNKIMHRTSILLSTGLLCLNMSVITICISMYSYI